jgi:hypothetical protein
MLTRTLEVPTTKDMLTGLRFIKFNLSKFDDLLLTSATKTERSTTGCHANEYAAQCLHDTLGDLHKLPI